MNAVDQWQERTEEFVKAHQSLSAFMERVESGLMGSEPHGPSVQFAVEVLSHHYFEYRKSALPVSFAESVRKTWPVDDWLLECFARHCDQEIMRADGTDRTDPEHKKLGVAMAATCLVASIQEEPTYAKIAEQTSDLLCSADVFDHALIAAILQAANVVNSHEIMDEFAVEVSAHKHEIAQLRQRTFLDRLKAVLSWSYVLAEPFNYPIVDLNDRFAEEVANEFAVHLQQRIEANDVEAIVTALHIGTSCHDESVVLDYLRQLTSLELVRITGRMRTDYISDVIKFDHSVCAIEPIRERIEDVVDELHVGLAPGQGADYGNREAGEMGLLKRWYEAAPDDPRLPKVTRGLAERFTDGFRRKLYLYGLDRLVPMVPQSVKRIKQK